ncbi:AraC family transcriptional regulator [Bradyrhizobium sp. UFLA05-109]
MKLPDLGDVSSMQPDGSPPTVVTAGGAPGESGVVVADLRYRGGLCLQAKLRQHVVTFASGVPHMRRVAGRLVRHDVEGDLSIFPAGIDTAVEADSDVRTLLIAIDPERLALAAAEDCAAGAQLMERFSRCDESLKQLGQPLLDECANGYPRGRLFWNETAGRLIARLAASYTTGPKPANGVLGSTKLRQIRDYLMAHLDEPIDVATLAGMCSRSQFHFSRIFRREVGVSPYRYVVHLRLRRAVELVREGRLPLAQIAFATGFADQSHLSRWVKREHGVSMTQLTSRRSKLR